MTSRQTTGGVFALCIALSAVWAQANDAPIPQRFSSRQMGVDVTLTLYAGGKDVANVASAAAFARIAELNRIFSDYDADSEVMRLCRGAETDQPKQVSPELYHVLATAADLSRRSHGAFDVTVGPLTKLWRRARRRAELPDARLLAETRQRVGWELVRLEPDGMSVALQRPDLQLDFGALVKGYAADEALAVLRRHGVSRALVAIAGDIFAGDSPPDAPGWRIGVAPLSGDDSPLSQVLWVTNGAVSTSGDAFQFVEIEGVRYSHILDPRTGLGLTHHSQVTIVARRGIDADSLATAASVLGPENGLSLVEKSGAAGWFLIAGQGQTRTLSTQNWSWEFLNTADVSTPTPQNSNASEQCEK